MPASASREEVEAAARANENVLRFVDGLTARAQYLAGADIASGSPSTRYQGTLTASASVAMSSTTEMRSRAQNPSWKIPMT